MPSDGNSEADRNRLRNSCRNAVHTFASLLKAMGIRIEVEIKIPGHPSLPMTMIYAKIIDKLKEREIMKFDSMRLS